MSGASVNVRKVFSCVAVYITLLSSLQIPASANIWRPNSADSPLQIILPKSSSVWVANEKPRVIVFNYTGEEVETWTIQILRNDGTVIKDFPKEIIFRSSLKFPSSSTSLLFDKSVALDANVRTGIHKVSICGSFRERKNNPGVICVTGDEFYIEGVSETKKTPRSAKHEERYKARKEANENHLRRVDLEKIWPINTTKCTMTRILKPTKEEFTEKCMKPAQACIISGMMEDWRALKTWQLDSFENDPRIADGIYIGERQEMIPLRVYHDYVKRRAQCDTVPWMVFMPDVFDMYPELLEDYTVPDFFSEDDDFMAKVDEDLRMDWRWIIMAPRGSGSGWHVDPANTTGWLALATGAKLWGLYPPSQYQIPGVKNNYYQKRDYNMDDAFNWWIYTRPYLEQNLPLECVQKAGDIVFIPSGWWHSVLNLDNTVAVTQNFCNKYSIKQCLKELKDQADSDGNFIGKTFEQLRHVYGTSYAELFEEDDKHFESPTEGMGLTSTQIKERKLNELKMFLSGEFKQV